MSPLGIYLFPLLIDMVLSTLFFVCSLRMAESGASAFAVSMVCTAWALTYSVTAFSCGRLITRNNAAVFAIGSCVALAAVSGLFILIPGLVAQYVLMVASGMIIAFFFTPFQVFMKSVMAGTSHGLGASIGLYTAAWSSGMAIGPFVSGMLWQGYGWQVCHLVNALAALTCAAGLYRLRHYALPGRTILAVAEPVRQYNYSGERNFVIIGWVCGGICCFIIALIRGVFPVLATSLEVSKSHQGMMFAVLFLAQALTGLALCAFPRWMYYRQPIVLMSVSGCLGLVVFGFGTGAGMFFLAALLFGIYSGMSSCYIVFHALVHPSQSTRNVAVNEAIVGVTGIVGPIFGGLLADRAGLSAPFLVSVFLVASAILIQWRAHRTNSVVGR